MNKLVPTRKLFHIHSADIPSEKNRAGIKPLNVVKYNHNGSYFMSAGNDKRINLWNASSGSHIKSYDAHGYEVTDLCISKDNAKFASVGGDKPVFYWDVAAAVTIRRFAGHFQRVNAVAMSDDGAVIVSGKHFYLLGLRKVLTTLRYDYGIQRVIRKYLYKYSMMQRTVSLLFGFKIMKLSPVQLMEGSGRTI